MNTAVMSDTVFNCVGVCQIGDADVDECPSDEEPAEGINDRQQGAPMGKDAVKVCRTLIH